MSKSGDEDLVDDLTSELSELIKFKSVGTDSRYFQDTKDCAAHVKKLLEQRNLDVEEWFIHEDTHAALFGKRIVSDDLPTVLFYGHYDVQPADPLDLWESDPFKLTKRGDNLYGRGANDNKGQLICVLKAIETFIASDLRDKVNIKILVEGEEESGSEVLYQVLKDESYRKKLEADHLLVVDVGMDSLEKPSILLGARGLLATEVTISVADKDGHSGEWGGKVDNAGLILSNMISKFKDESGRILISKFYDNIETYSGVDLQTDNEVIDSAKSSLGCKKFFPESGFTLAESGTVRPTCDINGCIAGYTDEGFKTVIPSKAMAKISFRLVKGQDPERIFQLFKSYLEELCPEDVEMELLNHGGGKAIFSPSNSKTIQILQSSVEKVFNKKCKLSICGGSIPVASKVWEASGGGIAFVGTGLPDDGIHAPNEKFSQQQLLLGYKIILQFLEDLSI